MPNLNIDKHYSRLSRILICKHEPVILLLAVLAFVLGLGFLFGSVSSSNYRILTTIAHEYVWIVMLTIYSFLKFKEVLSYRLQLKFRYVSSFIGMWIWTFLLLSATVFDNFKTTPTEFLLVVPILCEVWSLALVIYDSKYTKRG